MHYSNDYSVTAFETYLKS